MPRSSLALLPILALAGVTPSWAARWDPIPAEDLAVTAPQVPGADAEVLLWEIRAEDVLRENTLATTVHHQVRIRIFTERGKEQSSQIEIRHLRGGRVRELEARTVLPDGRVVEVRPTDVFERMLLERGRDRVKATSFTFPAVEPGAILEYRWVQSWFDGGLNTVIDLRRKEPVQRLVCRFKPLAFEGLGLRVTGVNVYFPALQKDAQGYYTTSAMRLAPFRSEPMMPPEIELHPLLLVYYEDSEKGGSEQYWKQAGRQFYEEDRKAMSGARAIVETARSIVGREPTDEAKLARLADYCRREIRNLSREKVEESPRIAWPRNAMETLETRTGSTWTIHALFASLAAGLGYDARIAHVADREETFFRRTIPLGQSLSSSLVAVRLGPEWRFFDPAHPLPPGMLRWQVEGQEALIPDAKDPQWVTTPRSPAERSRVRRIADLRLSEDGTLEGELAWEYEGHVGLQRKVDLGFLDERARVEEIGSRVRRRLPTAELSSFRFDAVEGPGLPVRVSCQVRVPGFAQATTRRLFFAPSVFHKGVPALFTDERRDSPIDFHHAWSEYDSVLIRFPEGYELDHPEVPSNLTIGDFGGYQLRVGVFQGRQLVYRREFWLDQIRFSHRNYPGLRETFAAVQERDEYSLALKRSGAGD